MATKIEGWEYQKGEWTMYNEISFYRHPVGKEEEPSERPATLVLHDGDKHERVFTESEALPDIESLLKWVHRVTVYMRECGEPRPDAERMVGFMATRYGITLDPA